jgi:hypothetical protein
MRTTDAGEDHISSTIRAELARRRLAQPDLAEAIGMHWVTLSKRMNGRTDWTVPEVRAVAAFFGMDVVDLIGRQAS